VRLLVQVSAVAQRHPVQGTAAEIAIEAMIRIDARLRRELPGKAQLVLQVHDEFVVEVDDDESAAGAVKRILEQEMTAAFEALLPGAPTTWLVDAHAGLNWAAAKEGGKGAWLSRSIWRQQGVIALAFGDHGEGLGSLATDMKETAAGQMAEQVHTLICETMPITTLASTDDETGELREHCWPKDLRRNNHFNFAVRPKSKSRTD
jgi:hypothetical protein